MNDRHLLWGAGQKEPLARCHFHENTNIIFIFTAVHANETGKGTLHLGSCFINKEVNRNGGWAHHELKHLSTPSCATPASHVAAAGDWEPSCWVGGLDAL